MKRPIAAWARGIAIACVLAFMASGTFGQQQWVEDFSTEVVFDGHTQPTAVRFAPDGRVFVAEKAGRVWAYDDLDDDTPDLVIDVSLLVHDFWDRGLLGLAVDPDFPTQPYVYILYTYNKDANDPGSPIPRWDDFCDSPPGPTIDGCSVNGRLSKFEVALDNTPVGGEQVLIEDYWCQQFPSHSVGDLVFDPVTRALYAAAGDGASFGLVDYGQRGGQYEEPTTPLNVCDDPPAGIGGTMEPPTAEGGALRSQDIRTPEDPLTYDGTLLRIDPDTGLGISANPLFGGPYVDDDRLVAFGLRNPYRLAIRPGTREVWIGDVGWSAYEEINRLIDPGGPRVENFGWPCYEGPERQPGYDAAGLDLCETLYSATGNSAAIAPRFSYSHTENIDPDPEPFRCSRLNSTSISGLAFYEGTAYPAIYDDALFFVDYPRRCMFVMLPNVLGIPDPTNVSAFADMMPGAVDLQLGPDGLLYFVDYDQGRVHRVVYQSSNQAPTARIVATPENGPSPLQLTLDGSTSSDPDPDDTLSFAWDLNGDGVFGEFTGPVWTGTVPLDGVFEVALRVTDLAGEFDTATAEVVVGNAPPTVSIDSPAAGFVWSVGEMVQLQGSATDPEDGTVPAAEFEWTVRALHCPSDCLVESIETFSGTTMPVVFGPDVELPGFLEVELTVTDAGIPSQPGVGRLSQTTTMLFSPRTVDLQFSTLPGGLNLVVGTSSRATPFTETAIPGAQLTLSAPSPQSFLLDSWDFRSWDDAPGEAATRNLVAPTLPRTYTAVYGREGCALVDITCDGVDDDCDNQVDEDYVGIPTTCGLGPCESSGMTQCIDGVESDSCVPDPILGPDDNCNTIDDDCDGMPDDDFPAGPSSCGVGACAGNGGTITCVLGVVTDTCDPLAGAAGSDATCDGIDDDCDGQVDEDFVPTATSCGLGECAGNVGQRTCVNGVVVDTCDPLGGATVDDASCNGRDDDCDGSTDEDVTTGNVTCGVGACDGNTGFRVCDPDPFVIFGVNRDGLVDSINLDTLVSQDELPLLFGTQAAELDPATQRVYYFEAEQNATLFAYWDPFTGNNQIVRVYNPGIGEFPKRLAVAPDGTMWMMDADEDLFIVDQATGDLTLLGTVTGVELGQFGGTGDFAFAPDGTLWLATNQSVYTVDTETLTATLVFEDNLDVQGVGDVVYTGLAFCDGKLYGSDAQELTGISEIYEIDHVTGAITSVITSNHFYNDLTSCPSNGRYGVTFSDTCDPFAGAAADDATCDDVDDDCDGAVDEDFVETLTSCGVGACSGNVGASVCSAGVVVDTCDPLAGATLDSDCDGVDDDCDGTEDDDFVAGPVSCGLGECAGNQGVQSCDAGILSSTCDPLAGAAVGDASCNGLDDDCDGQTDEDFVDGPNSCGVGACAGNTGTQQCLPDAIPTYAVNFAGELFELDRAQQSDVQIGTLPVGSLAIEVDPATGRIYFFESTFASDLFGYFDPSTSQTTTVRDYDPAPGAFPQMLAMAPDGTLWMVDYGLQIFSVDIATGDLTPHGTLSGIPSSARGDITFDTLGRGWLATGDDLYAVDLAAGVAVVAHADLLEDPWVFTGLGACDGKLYAVDSGPGLARVYEIDPDSGQTTQLWTGGDVFDDLTSCPADGSGSVTPIDTCDPFAGAAADDTVCNDIDDDCDGEVDEEFVESPTTCGQGACASNTGALSCIGGVVLDTCDPFAGATLDTDCDGVDDDCDGTEDDDFVAGPVTCGLGECAGNQGVQSCDAGQLNTTCDPLAGAAPDDASCNGLDDDCDGQTDEDFVDGPNTCGVGACEGNVGTQECVTDTIPTYAVNFAGRIFELDRSGQSDVQLGTLPVGSLTAELDPATGRVYYFESTFNSDLFGYFDPVSSQNVTVRDYVPAPGVFPQMLAMAPDGTLWMVDFLLRIFTVDIATGDLTAAGTLSGIPINARGDITFDTTGRAWLVTLRDLYRVDLVSGVAVSARTALIPADRSFTGLAACDGKLYAVDSGIGLARVYELDPDVGSIQQLWVASSAIDDLTSCPSDGSVPVTPIDTCDPLAGAGTDDATCDGVDDDCDGSADEDFASTPTTCGVGACAGNGGATECVDGSTIDTCDPFAGAAPLDGTCDGVDDDCDGSADEDFASTPTTCGVGACAGNGGATECVDGSTIDTCDPFAGAAPLDDTCNDVDDDCDGTSDEDVAAAERLADACSWSAATELTWNALPAAQYYQVIRGEPERAAWRRR